MGQKEAIAKSAIAKTPRAISSGDYQQCTARGGHGKRCILKAQPGRKRCEKCSRMNRESLRRNWPTRMVLCSRRDDLKRGFVWNESEYITKEWLKGLYRKRGAVCYWCGARHLNVVNRRGADGLSIERLENRLPHLKRNCVFACSDCNRRSWRSKFMMYPYHILKYRYSVDVRLSRETMIRQDRISLEIMAHNQPKQCQAPCERHLVE